MEFYRRKYTKLIYNGVEYWCTWDQIIAKYEHEDGEENESELEQLAEENLKEETEDDL